MTDLIRAEGPCRVYAFDVDNPTDEPVRLQLVRDSGSVIVDVMCGPYHAHSDPSMEPPGSPWRESWLWQESATAVAVLKDAAVILRAANSGAITRAYLAYASPGQGAQVALVEL